MDIKIISELINLIKTSGLSGIEIEENGTRIRLENQGGGLSAISDNSFVSEITEPEIIEEKEEENFHIIKAMMVGVFCLPEKAGKKPLEAGDEISVGTVVCAIEAMKMMCEVESDVEGEFVEFICSDGEQVEFGQPLLKIKKADQHRKV